MTNKTEDLDKLVDDIYGDKRENGVVIKIKRSTNPGKATLDEVVQDVYGKDTDKKT